MYPLGFPVTENIEVLININDKGRPGQIEIVFDFEDRSGLPVEMGSTLTIKFIDNTTYSFIASSRKLKSSKMYFTIAEAGSQTATSYSNKSDNLLTDKLLKVDIHSFEISAEYKKREITINETKSAIIKNTIRCLLNPYP